MKMSMIVGQLRIALQRAANELSLRIVSFVIFSSIQLSYAVLLNLFTYLPSESFLSGMSAP